MGDAERFRRDSLSPPTAAPTGLPVSIGRTVGVHQIPERLDTLPSRVSGLVFRVRGFRWGELLGARRWLHATTEPGASPRHRAS